MNLDKISGKETVSTSIPEEKEPPVEVEEKKPVKKKGKPRGGNSPMIGNNMMNLEEGENNKFMAINMALFNMQDIDMSSVEEVAQRLNDYFALYAQYDLKPTVSGMAMALNSHDRRWLWSVTHDAPLNGRGDMSTLPREVSDCIKKAYFLLETSWESYMNSGKINPVAGIFLAKNNYGYQDKTEYVLTPNQNQDSDYSAEDIRARYINSAEPKRLSTINSDEEND